MRKKLPLLLTALLIISMVSIFNFQLENVRAEVGVNPGLKAANFELLNLEGQKISLNDFKGQKILINFWASWCPPCQQEMPDLQKLKSENGDQLVILAVNIGESRAAAAKFMADNDFDFTVLLDKDKKIARKYLVRAVPTSYFVDQEGIIKEKIIGILNYQQMLELAELSE